MDIYIRQLIEDFRRNTKNAGSGKIRSEDNNPANKGKYPYGRNKKLSDIVGISYVQLPSDETLNDKQVSLVTKEMIRLLNSYNIFPDFPEKLPDRIKYRVLRDNWEIRQVTFSVGESHLEFCNNDKDNCPFEGYCKVCENELDDLNDVNKLLPTKDEIDSFMAHHRKDQIKNIIKNVNLEGTIPDIYNYCDRWCERCKFTSRCANYSINREIESEKEYNLDNEEFWKELSAIMNANLELLHEMAKEMDINLEEIDHSNEHADDEIDDHPLMHLSKEYMQKVVKWLNENLDEITRLTALYKSEDDGRIIELEDAVQVIQWYSIFISVKYHRALSGMESKGDKDMTDDSNGSAKIATIGVERSIAAFTYLHGILKKKEDEILELLVLLKKISVLADKTFPDSRNFKRPGFDD